MNEKEVDVAIESAFKTLVEDKNFSWIRNSSILKRAYCLGLYAGLRAVTDESNLRELLLEMVRGTMFARSGEDTFGSTRIGRIYNDLKDQFNQSLEKSGRRLD